ncbi:MAG: Cof-type HAD-IIB family hydrolase [Coriobacteriales bacterium]|nr:Cof-type HAD-IIB family hydrolase [Coriobacteriales bacterium]
MGQRDIRLVAVDEDGTFLRDHVHYDRERFERIFVTMRERGIRFVVATGNQSYQVQSLFPAHVEEMGIVSANGAYVLDGTQPVYAARASAEACRRMIDAIHELPHIPFSMLGVAGAYVERGSDQAFFDDMARYCVRQDWVDSFDDVDDQVFMFSSVVDEDVVEDCIARFRTITDGLMDVVGSGDGYFDVVCPGVSKASGLAMLLERWGIGPEQMVAFGDSDNDLAMLELAGLSFAMDNAPQNVKDVADRVAPACTDDGVLQMLEELL